MSPCCRKPITGSSLRGWVIVFSTAVVFSVNAGFYGTQSLFLEHLLAVYGKSVTSTALVLSLEFSIRYMSSPLVSILCARFGHRQSAICGGFMCSLGFVLTGCAPSLPWIYATHGLGTNMFTVAKVSIVNMYFSKHRGKANAASYVLYALGSIYMAQLVPVLFSTYGFFGGCLLIGGLTSHFIPVGALLCPIIEGPAIGEKSSPVKKSVLPMRHCPETAGKDCSFDRNAIAPQDGRLKGSMQAVSLWRRWRHGWFRLMTENIGIALLMDRNLLVLCVFLYGVYYSTISSSAFIAGSFLERGFTIGQVSLMISMVGGLEIGTRTLSGFICDIPRLRPLRGLMLGGTALVSGFAGFFLHFPKTVELAMMVFIVCKICSGLVVCHWPTVMSDIVLPSHITQGVGICRFFSGIGFLLGPLIGGCIRDVRRSYRIVFQVAGAQLVLLSTCFIIVTVLSLRKNVRDTQNTDADLQERTVSDNKEQPPPPIDGVQSRRDNK